MSDRRRKSPLRLAVLISGGGTTLRNLLEKIDAGQIDARVDLVISSHPTAAGLQFARDADIPFQVVEQKQYSSPDAFSQAIFESCRKAQVGLVTMGGFLKFVPIPADFENRVMNIHPSLIPAFCGRGLYGLRVHQAVLDYGVKVTGCTVHFVDNQYDHGPIILQHTVPVADDDTPETLAARVFATECDAYPEAIALYAASRLRVKGRRVLIDEPRAT